jgi:hypothetical protein
VTDEIVLDSWLQQARGVIGREPGPDERYVFEFDSVAPRLVHMLGVRDPLRVSWYVGDELVERRTLRPWVGVGRARCDSVVEEAVDKSSLQDDTCIATIGGEEA